MIIHKVSTTNDRTIERKKGKFGNHMTAKTPKWKEMGGRKEKGFAKTKEKKSAPKSTFRGRK